MDLNGGHEALERLRKAIGAENVTVLDTDQAVEAMPWPSVDNDESDDAGGSGVSDGLELGEYYYRPNSDDDDDDDLAQQVRHLQLAVENLQLVIRNEDTGVGVQNDEHNQLNAEQHAHFVERLREQLENHEAMLRGLEAQLADAENLRADEDVGVPVEFEVADGNDEDIGIVDLNEDEDVPGDLPVVVINLP